MMEALRRIVGGPALLLALVFVPVAWGQPDKSPSVSDTSLDELQGTWDLRLFNYDRRLRDMVRQTVEAVLAGQHSSALVEKTMGGEVRRPDKAAVKIPAEALEADISISIDTAPGADQPAREAQISTQRLAAVSEPVMFGPEGTTFKRPVTITLPYDPAILSAKAIQVSALKVYYWNPTTDAWERLESVVNADERTVSAQTGHFSIYQAMGPPGGGIGVAAAEIALGFKAAYAFPNPVRGQNTVTIRVQPGQADSVAVRIYDLAGRKVHDSSSFNSLGALDDGNGLGPQFTYDHVWDVSGVGSGVYGYVVTAKKTGQANVVKSGKVAVVK